MVGTPEGPHHHNGLEVLSHRKSFRLQGLETENVETANQGTEVTRVRQRLDLRNLGSEGNRRLMAGNHALTRHGVGGDAGAGGGSIEVLAGRGDGQQVADEDGKPVDSTDFAVT